MFFDVRSNDSFNFPLGLIKYIVIVIVTNNNDNNVENQHSQNGITVLKRRLVLK